MFIKIPDYFIPRSAFWEAFSYTIPFEVAGNTQYQKGVRASRLSAVYAFLSYIPIVNLIALSIFLAKQNKAFFSTSYGKALLARSIVCMSIVLVPLVALMDIVGTFMKVRGVAKIRFTNFNPYAIQVEERVKNFKTNPNAENAKALKASINDLIMNDEIVMYLSQVNPIIKKHEREVRKDSLIL